MINLKRLPGVLYKRRNEFIVIISVVCVVVYYLFHWGVVCTNLEIWTHVNKLCQLHRNGEAVGTLCNPLCIDKTIESVYCKAFHAGKEVVFSAEWQGIQLVFKSSYRINDEVDPVYWLDNRGQQQYPNEQEFQRMVQDVVASKLNLSIPSDQLKKLCSLDISTTTESTLPRHVEMKNIWMLLHDNEYLISALFSDRGFFPQLIGTCGTFFAVEYVHPVKSMVHMFSLSEEQNEWASRVKLAIMMLDLLEEMEINLPEPFSLCDIKMSHFGMAANGQRLKFLDLDSVFPRRIANRITADGSSCSQDTDCDFFDCHSQCNIMTGVCDAPVTNNNHQVVCEKMFLGWTLSGAVVVPGLLMSRHTPSSLAVLLRMCASPDSDVAPVDSVKRRLYTLLTELQQTLTNDEFL